MPSFFSRLRSVFTGRSKPSEHVAKEGVFSISPEQSRSNPDISEDWWLRKIMQPSESQPDVGFGWLTEPYAAKFNLIWGNEQPPDYEKYIVMHHRVPDVKRAMDLKVNLSVGKDFTFEYPEPKRKRIMAASGVDEGDETTEELMTLLMDKVREIAERVDLAKNIRAIGYDLLVLGNAFVENCYEDYDYLDTFANYSVDQGFPKWINDRKKEGRGYNSDEYRVWHTTEAEDKSTPMNYTDWLKQPGSPWQRTDRKAVRVAVGRGRIKGIKVLDPRWMRVRRDPYGATHGYIQLIGFPPVVFDAKQIAHFRNNPKSWGIYNIYGSSDLQSLIKTQEQIWSIEATMQTYADNVSGAGIFWGPKDIQSDLSPEVSEKIFWDTWDNHIKTRKAGTRIAFYGNFAYEDFKGSEQAMKAVEDYLNNYLGVRRNMALGLPESVSGAEENVGTRTTAESSWDNFIVNEMDIQRRMGRETMESIIAPALEQEVKFDDEFGAKVLACLDKLGIEYGGRDDDKGTMDDFELPLWLLPDMAWEEIGREDQNNQMTRVVSAYQAGIMKLSEARREIGMGVAEDDPDGYITEMQPAPVQPGQGDPWLDKAVGQYRAGVLRHECH